MVSSIQTLLRSSTRQATQPLALTIWILGSLASCGGGGGGGGGAVFPNAGQAEGSWNLHRIGDDCDGPEVRSLTMQVVELASPNFRVLLGETGQEFEFAAQIDGDEFQFSGISVVGNTILEVLSADLVLAPSGNSMSGTMFGIETTNGMDCWFEEMVHVYRQDDTTADPIQGGWQLLGSLDADPGASCPGASDEMTVFEVQLLPRRNREFTALFSGPGYEFHLDAKRTGNQLRVTGDDDVEISGAPGELRVLSGSTLQFDEILQELSGNLRFAIDFPQQTCTYEFDIHGVRTPTGVRYLPFLADVLGEQNLMGIDPSHPTEPVALGPPGVHPEILNGTFVSGFAGVAYSAEFSQPSGKILDRRPETLFFAKVDGIYSVDLVQRRDGFGDVLTPAPRRVLAMELSDYPGLRVYSDYGSLKGVLHFCGIANGNLEYLVEVAHDGSVRAEELPRSFPRGLAFDPTDGSYQGLYLYAWTQSELVLGRVGQTQTIDQNITGNFELADDGSLYYFTQDAVRKFDSATQTVSTVLEVGGNRLMGPSEESDFYFSRAFSEDTAVDGEIDLYRERDGVVLSLHSDTNAAVFDAFSVASLVVTEDHLLFQYRTETEGIRVYSMPKNGSSGLVDITSPTIEYSLRNDLVAGMEDRLYLGNHDLHALVVAPDTGDVVEALDTRLRGVIQKAELHTQKRNEPAAVLLEQNGRLGVIEGDNGSADPFQTTSVLGMVTGTNWQLAVHGQHVLLSSFQSGAGGRFLFYANSAQPDSLIQVTDTALEVDWPIR